MATPLPSAPDAALVAVTADIQSAKMLVAADDGYFGVIGYQHPVLTCWVSVGDGRLGFRLEVTGYPGQAPSGQPWDVVANAPLPPAHWPVGARAGQVLRADWSVANGHAPYLACERQAMIGHDNWRNDLPGKVWTASKTVADYLTQLHEALLGSRLPQRVS